MPSQHGATQWVRREAEAAKNFVKMAYTPDIDDRHPDAPHTSESEDVSIPDVLKTGIFMTRISEKTQKQVLFRIDPDEGRILYKSSQSRISMYKIYYSKHY